MTRSEVHGDTVDILLAEDNPADAHLARQALRETGLPLRIHHVTDGIECLNFLNRAGDTYREAPAPALILLDLNMPRMSGSDVLRTMKQQDTALRHIPVVVLTTSNHHTDIETSYKLGANSFITKPMDLDDFNDKIATMCRYWFGTATLPPHSPALRPTFS